MFTANQYTEEIFAERHVAYGTYIEYNQLILMCDDACPPIANIV